MSKPPSLFEWMVVGAGPAGIAAVGKLIDAGIPAAKIGWLDPHFEVGDLGRKWNAVPSNTSVSLFLRFLNHSAAFDFKKRPDKFAIEGRDPKENCPLEEIAAPLRWVTKQLQEKVSAMEGTAIALNLSQGRWEVKTESASYFAKKVILAIGSDPKSLTHPAHEAISMDIALNPAKLAKAVQKKDTVGVFGSSHSAILVLANLVELKVKGVINFYRSPHRYAVYFDDWILFDDTGLKGFTAKWAREHLDGTPPKNLKRVLVSDHAFEESLALCNKLIYATGFERRKLPVLEQYETLNYDDKTGIIAPCLFGLGIAFPQTKLNRLGHLETRVGLWKFMDYLETILPCWMKYGSH